MRRSAWLACAAVVIGGLAVLAAQPRPTDTVAFEGARLILGDSQPAIENGVIVVSGGHIQGIGRRPDVRVPDGASHVDLSGKTVIPGLIDAHSHIGYMRDLTSGPQNYTRENILDHMHRFAYHGVVAAMAMGSDYGELPYQLRDEIAKGADPAAALFLSAGRGLAPPDEIRPDNMRHSAYRIVTESDARTAVQELSARRVRIIKTWVDDRGGAVHKLSPALYGAIIDEAHKHGMKVAVHATGLADAKALLRANIDIFAHMVEEVDDEFVSMVKARPNVAFLLALGGPRRPIYAPWLDPPDPLVRETVSPAQIARLQKRLRDTTPAVRDATRAAWAKLAHGVATLNAAGVTIGLGTDGGGQTGDQFVGWTVHTELENMVDAGMTPAQAITAATRTNAAILGLPELGSLAVGKSADFAVLDANPLDAITNSRRISRVFLRGRELDRTSLRAGWTGGASH